MAQGRSHKLVVLGVVALLFLGACQPDEQGPAGGEAPQAETEELKRATAEPADVKGAPFPPERPTELPEHEQPPMPVPDGPVRGKLAPTNEATGAEEMGRPDQSIEFDAYTDLDDPTPPISDVGEVSIAENDQTVIMTGNWFVSFSMDGGAT
jgi:hypothetical protein